MVTAILMGVLSIEGFALWRVAEGLHRRGKTLADLGFRISAPMRSYGAGIAIAAVYCTAAIYTDPAIAASAFHFPR
jgi:hypothetical protein